VAAAGAVKDPSALVRGSLLVLASCRTGIAQTLATDVLALLNGAAPAQALNRAPGKDNLDSIAAEVLAKASAKSCSGSGCCMGSPQACEASMNHALVPLADHSHPDVQYAEQADLQTPQNLDGYPSPLPASTTYQCRPAEAAL
jgi:hypothetical protein